MNGLWQEMVCSSSLDMHTQKPKNQSGGDGVNGLPTLESYGGIAILLLLPFMSIILQTFIKCGGGGQNFPHLQI